MQEGRKVERLRDIDGQSAGGKNAYIYISIILTERERNRQRNRDMKRCLESPTSVYLITRETVQFFR